MNMKTFAEKSKALAQVWIWLMKTFAIEILKTFFYITEGNKCKNQLFFFRKRAFQGLRDTAFKNLLQLGSIKKITRQQYKVLIETYDKSNPYNLASIRFIPKSSGLRLISPIKKGILSEEEIRNAKQLIRFITDRFFPDVKTIRSDEDYQQSWLKYIESLVGKNRSSTFIVKVDISDAFGSVKHDLLFNILSDVEKDLPVLVKFDAFANNSKNSKKVLLIPSSEESHCLETIHNDRRNLEKIATLEVNVKKTFENIRRMVRTQLFQVGVHQRFLIVKGLAQGGSLSSALCDLYYSAMCHKYLRKFTGKETTMMRSVDDFLYITPRKTEAENFLCLMKQGIDEFNCYINPTKTMHNLDNECRIPYRGTIFCPASNQVLVSVSSLTSCPPRYSIKLNRSSNPGTFTILKLRQILMSRLSKMPHSSSTSIPAIVSNIWRLGLNIGARLPCLIKIVLLPERNVNSRFLSRSTQGLGKIMWTKLNEGWKDGGRPVTLSRPFCIAVFLAGIHTMLQNGKRQPPLKCLKRNIKKRFTQLWEEIPEQERKLLPHLTSLPFTNFDAIKH